jgi:hypothetical protein
MSLEPIAAIRLAAYAARAKRSRVSADLLECPGERLDVGVGQVTREVLLDRKAMVQARCLQRPTALVREDDQERPPIVLGPLAAHEARLFHAVDHARETTLAVQDSLRELVHAQSPRFVFQVDEEVVPTDRNPGVALHLGVEHVHKRERALEVEAPRSKTLG